MSHKLLLPPIAQLLVEALGMAEVLEEFDARACYFTDNLLDLLKRFSFQLNHPRTNLQNKQTLGVQPLSQDL